MTTARTLANRLGEKWQPSPLIVTRWSPVRRTPT